MLKNKHDLCILVCECFILRILIFIFPLLVGKNGSKFCMHTFLLRFIFLSYILSFSSINTTHLCSITTILAPSSCEACLLGSANSTETLPSILITGGIQPEAQGSGGGRREGVVVWVRWRTNRKRTPNARKRERGKVLITLGMGMDCSLDLFSGYILFTQSQAHAHARKHSSTHARARTQALIHARARSTYAARGWTVLGFPDIKLATQASSNQARKHDIRRFHQCIERWLCWVVWTVYSTSIQPYNYSLCTQRTHKKTRSAHKSEHTSPRTSVYINVTHCSINHEE